MNRPVPMRDTTDYFTDNEIEMLLAYAGNERNKVLFTILAQTGRRISEITGDKKKNIDGLTVQDINFNDHLINFTILKKHRPFKTWIPVKADLTIMLKGYVERNRITGKLFKISRRRADQIIRAAAKRANIQNAHLHKFRHSFCIRLAKAIKNPLDIEKALEYTQHSNINYFLYYIRLYANKEARDLIELV